MKTIATVAAVTVAAGASLGLFYWVMASEHAYDPTDLLRIRPAGKAYRFEVMDSTDSTLWRVTSPEGANLGRIDYGVIPSTFRQEVPAGSAKPRDLVAGEALKTRTVTDTDVLVHEGRAAGARSMSWGVSMFTPRSGSTIQP
jgi:hypothetical protein